MNKRTVLLVSLLLILIIVVGLVILLLCIVPSVTTAQVEDGIYSQVNKLRQDSGLNALTRDPNLDALARQFSLSEFSNSVGEATELHYLLHNSWWVSYTGGSPKLVKGTAQEQVEYCLKNNELKDAMLRSEARATGVGVVVAGSKVYYTQVFDVLNAVGGSGSPIRLQENPQATDVSWEQVKEFVIQDDTNEHPYIANSFTLADFAAQLHNRAEAAGIKTAFVSVEFAEGPARALNAFNTTDRGLVYIDCTGPGFQSPIFSGNSTEQDIYAKYDKVAYVVVGQAYGLIPLDKATSFDYGFYEQWTQQWNDYNTEAALYQQKYAEYNEAVTGITGISDPSEYARLQSMYNDLESMRLDLQRLMAILGDYRWNPAGNVTRVDIHW